MPFVFCLYIVRFLIQNSFFLMKWGIDFNKQIPPRSPLPLQASIINFSPLNTLLVTHCIPPLSMYFLQTLLLLKGLILYLFPTDLLWHFNVYLKNLKKMYLWIALDNSCCKATTVKWFNSGQKDQCRIIPYPPPPFLTFMKVKGMQETWFGLAQEILTWNVKGWRHPISVDSLIKKSPITIQDYILVQVIQIKLYVKVGFNLLFWKCYDLIKYTYNIFGVFSQIYIIYYKWTRIAFLQGGHVFMQLLYSPR